MYVILNNGLLATVDDEDYPLVAPLRWTALQSRNTWYAIARTSDRKTVRMHRLLVDAAPGMQVDHWDGNGLNNRRSNLRSCTNSQNQQNRHAIRSSSGFKGVYYDKHQKGVKRWCAAIGKERLGRFATPEQAAAVYDAEVLRRFGQFAATNQVLLARPGA